MSPRPIRSEDADSLHALLVAGLPDVSANKDRWLARWNWQYRDNPCRQGRPAGWVLTEKDRIVGHLGAVYLPLRVGQKRLIGVVGADYVVSDQALLRGGAFAGLQLAQAFFAGTAGCVQMATTANEKTNAVFARFGCRPVEWTREFWRAPATLSQLIRTCRGGNNRIARRLMTGALGNPVLNLLSRGYDFMGHTPALPVPAGCRLETATPQLAGELGSLWEAVVAGGTSDEIVDANLGVCPAWTGLTVERTEDYLCWRYVRHPQSDGFQVVAVRHSECGLLGAAVVSVDERPQRRVAPADAQPQRPGVSTHEAEPRRAAFMEEMIVFPDRADVFCCLMSASLKLACDCGADYLICAPGRLAVRERFWELGFESRARSAPAVTVGGLENVLDSAAIETFADNVQFHHGDMF